MKSIQKEFRKVVKEIQEDFPYYKPTNINLDSDRPSFELNGFKYDFFGSENQYSNVGLTVSDSDMMSSTYNKYIEEELDNIKNKKNYMLKHRLILTDATFRLYRKIKDKYPNKSIIPSIIKGNDNKIRIKYDDHGIFTINLNWKYSRRDSNDEKFSLLYDNLNFVSSDVSNGGVSIKIDTVDIDLNLKDLKMLFNNLDYLYETVIEPLLDDRLYFMDQKIGFKHKTNNIKKAVESSNFVRKMKINSVLCD